MLLDLNYSTTLVELGVPLKTEMHEGPSFSVFFRFLGCEQLFDDAGWRRQLSVCYQQGRQALHTYLMQRSYGMVRETWADHPRVPAVKCVISAVGSPIGESDAVLAVASARLVCLQGAL